jgi:hypothetical protein
VGVSTGGESGTVIDERLSPEVGSQIPVPLPTPHASDKADQLIGLSAQHLHSGHCTASMSRVVGRLAPDRPRPPANHFTHLPSSLKPPRSLVDSFFSSIAQHNHGINCAVSPGALCSGNIGFVSVNLFARHRREDRERICISLFGAEHRSTSAKCQ